MTRQSSGIVLLGLFLAMPGQAEPVQELIPLYRCVSLGDYKVVLRDAEGDGDLDFFFGHFPFTVGANTSAWLENTGSGQFEGPRVFAYLEPRLNAENFFEDIDGDNVIDDLRAESSGTGTRLTARFPFRDGVLAPPEVLEDTTRINHIVATGDFDGDGRVDLLRRWSDRDDPDENGLFISWGAADGGFTDSGFSWDEADFGEFVDVHVGEVDGVAGDDVVIEYLDRGMAASGFYYLAAGPTRTLEDSFLEVRTADSSRLERSDSVEYRTADVDADGLVDLIGVASVGAPTSNLSVTISFNEGDSEFSPWSEYVVEGRDDLRMVLAGVETSASEPRLLVFRTVADGGGQEATSWELLRVALSDPTAPEAWTVSVDSPLGALIYQDWPVAEYSAGVEDLDGDGDVDVYTIVRLRFGDPQTGPLGAQLLIAWNRGAAGYDFELVGRPAIRPEIVIAEDFDNDNDPDVIVGFDGEGHLTFFENDGTGRFDSGRQLRELLPTAYLEEGAGIAAVSGGDLTGDGIPDLALTYTRIEPGGANQFTRHACVVAVSLGDGSFSVPPALPPGFVGSFEDRPCFVSDFVDWDGDGDLDVTEGYGWRENLGGGLAANWNFLLEAGVARDAFFNPVELEAISRVGDINGDGSPDFAVAVTGPVSEDPSPGNPMPPIEAFMGIAINDGQGGVAHRIRLPVALYAADAFGNPVTLEFELYDMNADGLLDIVHYIPETDAFGNPSRSRVTWVLNSPDGLFEQSIPAGDGGVGVEIEMRQFDFNGDGHLDLGGLGQYLTANRKGIEISPVYDFIGPYLPYSALLLETADVDGDGDADFFVQGQPGGSEGLHVVRNLLVDHDSPAAVWLREEGAWGHEGNPALDIDGDGLNGFGEYAFGSDPFVPHDPLGPQMIVTRKGEEEAIEVRFRRRTQGAGAGFLYAVELSGDLRNWQSADLAGAAIVGEGGEFERVSLTIHPADYGLASGSCYVRFRVDSL